MDEVDVGAGRSILGPKRMAMINKINVETNIADHNLGLGYVSHHHCNTLLKEIEVERPGFTEHVRSMASKGVFMALVGITIDDVMNQTLFVKCDTFDQNMSDSDKEKSLLEIKGTIDETTHFVPTPVATAAIGDVAHELAFSAYCDFHVSAKDGTPLENSEHTEKLVRILASIWMPVNPVVYIGLDIKCDPNRKEDDVSVSTGTKVLAAVDTSGPFPTIVAPYGEGR